MTTASEATVSRVAPGPLALRACGLGLAVAVVLLGAAWLVGLPEGTGSYVLLGLAVAAGTGSAGLVLQTYASTLPPDHPQLVQRYLLGMVANFGLQILTVAVGCLVLHGADVKFAAIAAFGLAFAATATAQHTVGVLVIARPLRGAAPAAEAAETSTHTREPICQAQD